MPGKFIYFCLIFIVVTGFPFHSYSNNHGGHVQAERLADKDIEIDSLLQLAKGYWYKNPSLCIEIAQIGYEKSLKNNDRTKQADALNIIGAAYYFLEQLDSSILYLNRALDLSQLLEYNEGIAKVTNNLGLIHDYLGNYDRAMNFYYKSLEIEKESKNNLGIASTYLNIGSIYVYLQEYDKALEFMTNSLRLHQEEKNEDGILRCFTNIGSIYSDIGIPENALSYSKKALELSRKMKNPDVEAANLNNIGEIYFSLKNYVKSLEYYNLALAIEQKFNDRWSQANTLRNIGNNYFVQQKFEETGTFFEKAFEIAKKIESKILLKELYYDFYKFHEAQKNFPEALGFHVKYTNLKDSLFGEDRRKEISRIESSLKLKNTDQQFELIRNENEVKTLTIKNQRYALFITAIFSLLVLSLVFILYYRSLINKKAKKWLEHTHEISAHQKQLLEETIARLEEEEERYKALTFSIQDGLILIQDKKLVFANEAMCQLLGYENQTELLGLKPDEIISKEDLTLVTKNYEARIIGKDIPKSYNIRVKNKSGKSFEVSLRVKLIQLQKNPAIIGTVKDISKTGLYEKELIGAKEKAEKATLSKSLFLAGMSHEIRNHLNGIIGIADLLGETKLNKDQKEYVEVLKNSGDLLANIINDILDLSKIEAGQISLEVREFGLRQVISEVISLHELKAAKENLVLRSEINGDVPDCLLGDPTRLSQILTNLVGNALKFTDEGTIKIVVVKEEIIKGEVKLKFSVIDTGIGISEESQEKLFKPFSQTHAAVERKAGGSGLGLVICENLVRLMNGDIHVESEPGKGSNFWFTTTFHTVVPKKNGTSGKSTPKLINNRILIVEDNVLNQHLTTSILSKEGYESDIAANGQEGVDLFMKKFYSVILMDIQMPVMDGIEATLRIRDYEQKNYRSKAAIIAITAHTKEGDEQKLMNAGINFYLRKPFKPDALLTIINTLRNPEYALSN